MKKKEAAALAAKFENIVNDNATHRYVVEFRPAYDEDYDEFHLFVKPNSIIFENDWNLILGFAYITHHCFRYNVEDKEFVIW